jgi:glycosyltransferase involved in cell wall biosynthesis
VKILCFIDSLGSGGAQRQLTTLARWLKERGHDVQFLVYLQEEHFRPELDAVGIECHRVASSSRLGKMFAVRRALKRINPDVVLAFLNGPAFYAEIAALPQRRFGLVVGERLAEPELARGKKYWLRRFHGVADAVVANSHTNRLMLEKAYPGWKRKLTTIYNAVDLDRFKPVSENGQRQVSSGALRVVVAASYQAKKNMEHVARAMLLLRNGQKQAPVVVDWYGGPANDSNPLKEVQRFVAEHGLSDCIRFHPAQRDIEAEYAGAAAVGLFSFYEGLPNAVCEGMACQKPILLSDVCDAGSLVVEGENGFLCDPGSPQSIAQAFRRLATTSEKEREEMGIASRQKAEALFAGGPVNAIYEKVLQAAALRLPPPENCTWPVIVPQSAMHTLKKWHYDKEA